MGTKKESTFLYSLLLLVQFIVTELDNLSSVEQQSAVCSLLLKDFLCFCFAGCYSYYLATILHKVNVTVNCLSHIKVLLRLLYHSYLDRLQQMSRRIGLLQVCRSCKLAHIFPSLLSLYLNLSAFCTSAVSP